MWGAGPYVEQVVAMEAKAKAIGKGGELYYLFPSGGQTAPGPSMVRKAVDVPASQLELDLVCRKRFAEDCSLGRRA